MATATCLNENCQKDEWGLQKPIAEYSRDGPSCPECGTTRVRVEDAAPAPTDSVEDTAPVPADGSQPVPAGTRGGQAGSALADLGIALYDDSVSTETRRASIHEGAGIVGGAITRVMEWREDRDQAQTERARAAGLSESPAVEECLREDCSYMFDSDELAADQVRCPECNAVWDVVIEEETVASSPP